MTKKTESKRNLDSMVRDELRKQIMTGELPNGAHLSEIKLSKEYNVSRTPVREALCALAADGFIEMIPNRGAFVTTPSEEQLADLRHMYGTLMGTAARMSAEVLSETDVARLEKGLATMQDTSGTGFDDARMEMHQTLLNAVPSKIFGELMSTVINRLPQPVLLPVENSRQRAEIVQGYTYLLAALKRQKGDVVEKSMRELMALSWESWTSEASVAA